MDKPYEIQVLIRTDDSGFWATVAELPGVFAAGSTRAELLQSLDEAVRLYLDETGIPAELEDQRVEVQKFSLRAGGLVPA
jgi:predicted RNase H-like HicB family nuclease